MVRINLLPVRVSKKKEAGKQQLALFAVLLVAGIVLNVLWVQKKNAELAKREADVSDKKRQVERLDKIIGEVTSLKTQQQQLQEKLDVLDKLKQGRTGPVKMLDELARITPRKLWLKSLTEKDGKITFDGVAATNYEVSQFMEALEASQYFERVELKKSEAKAQGPFRIVEFALTGTAKYAPGVTAAVDEKAGKPGAKPAAAKKAGG